MLSHTATIGTCHEGPCEGLTCWEHCQLGKLCSEGRKCERDRPWLEFVWAPWVFPVQRHSVVLDHSASGKDATEPCLTLEPCTDTSRSTHGMAAGKLQLGKPQQQDMLCPGHSRVPSDGHGCSQTEQELEHLPAPSSHPTSFFKICFLNEIRTKNMMSRNVYKG